MKFVKNAVPSFDKQGVTGSSPVSPILLYKEFPRTKKPRTYDKLQMRKP